MRFLRQTLFGVVLAALSLAMTVYAVHLVVEAVRFNMDREASPPQARERVFAVEVQRAVPETHIPVLQAFGQVQSRRRLELRAAIGGRVVGLAEEFADGGTVQAGDVLVRIDPADAQAVLDRVGSDLLDAEAEQRDAQRSLVLAQDELQAAQEQAALRDRAFRRQVDLEERGVATAATVETAEL
ncbi:efflux transporter periplasmic adaptor subunit, partial [Pseudooceanicola lipolyticus]